MVKVKICGITQQEQAKQIADLGVDAMGFILYPPSPRYVQPDIVKKLIIGLPPFLTTVGVFVNEPIETIIQIMRKTGLDIAQLHGDESPEYCRHLSQSGIRWLKAFRVREKGDLEKLKGYRSKHFLLDAWSEKGHGGTGETFDWDLAKSASGQSEIILAGGITEENIEEAIEKVSPYGIDLSSGVEVSPGIKSIEKIERLLKRIGR